MQDQDFEVRRRGDFASIKPLTYAAEAFAEEMLCGCLRCNGIYYLQGQAASDWLTWLDENNVPVRWI